MEWKNNTTLLIMDDLKAHDGGMHVARQFLHLAPDFCYRQKDRRIKVMEGEQTLAVITRPAACEVLIHREGLLTTYAEEFGLYQKKQVLEIRTPFLEKVRSRIGVRIMAG